MGTSRWRTALFTRQDTGHIHKMLGSLALLHAAYCCSRFASSGWVAAGFDTDDDRTDLLLYLVHLLLNASPLFVISHIPTRIKNLENGQIYKQYVLHRVLFEFSLTHTLWQCSNARPGPPKLWWTTDVVAIGVVMLMSEVITHYFPTGLGTSIRHMAPDALAGPLPPWLFRKLLALSIIFGTTYYPLWRTWSLSEGRFTRRGAQLEFLSALCLTVGSEILSFGATLKRKRLVQNPFYVGTIYAAFVGASMTLKFLVLFREGPAAGTLALSGLCIAIRFSIPRSAHLPANVAAKFAPAALFALALPQVFAGASAGD